MRQFPRPEQGSGISASSLPPASPPLVGAPVGSTFDPKGLQGILARGNAIYPGGAQAPQGAGRPRDPTPMVGMNALPMNQMMMNAIQERLRGYTTRAADKSRTNRAGLSGEASPLGSLGNGLG